MPPPIPDRFQLEVRLGRDDDIEEWLGTDTSLDRPVLVRFLGPDASQERHSRFLEKLRTAATVNHPHLASVYTAGQVPGGSYAVTEWTGGMTLANRLASDETIAIEEFLPNAAGLALAVAALHEEGIIHGAIDAGAIFYAVDHPAKLGGFGRRERDRSASGDVRSLAVALEEALTGEPAGGPPPSELIDGLSPAVDQALRQAQTGVLGARQLADAIGSAPSPRLPDPEPTSWSRRVLAVAGLLALVALGLVALGSFFLGGEDSPIILPVPGETESVVLPTTTTTTRAPTDAVAPSIEIAEVSALDPFGDGSENNERLLALVDDDPGTSWRTETYRDRLDLLKPGVGVTMRIVGTPRLVELQGVSPGTEYVILWSQTAPRQPEDADVVAWGRVPASSISLQVPSRLGGFWTLWLTGLPERGPENHSAEVAEVRFRP